MTELERKQNSGSEKIPLQIVFVDLECLFRSENEEETTSTSTSRDVTNENQCRTNSEKQIDTEAANGGSTKFKTTLRNESIELSLNNADCVRELICPENNARVYVIGTAHYSEQSQRDVAAVISRIKPDCVVLELCASRTAILQLDEATLLDEAASQMTVEKFRSLLQKHHGNVAQAALECLLLHLSAHVTKQLGMAPGGEFRTAARAAYNLNHSTNRASDGASSAETSTPTSSSNCRVLLGDRPIAVTLKRAFATLSTWHKIKLFCSLIASSFESITREQVEAFKHHDMLVEALRQLAGSHPQFSKVLLDERDAYLATSLRVAALDIFQPARGQRQSRAAAESSNDDRKESETDSDSQSEQAEAQRVQRRPPVIVGVVGLGHVDGIVRYWNAHQASAEMMRAIQPLMFVPQNRSRIMPVLKWTFRIVVVAAAVQLGISVYSKISS